MKLKTISAIAILTIATVFQWPVKADGEAETRIRSLMAGQFDRPDSRLEVGPIVVVSDHAIAGWTQGDMGGRALLRRKGQDWQIVLCSGDQIKSAEALNKVGLPQSAANELAHRLAATEAKTDPARLLMFARFDGILMLEGGGNHPPHPSGHNQPSGHHPPAGHSAAPGGGHTGH